MNTSYTTVMDETGKFLIDVDGGINARTVCNGASHSYSRMPDAEGRQTLILCSNCGDTWVLSLTSKEKALVWAQVEFEGQGT